MFDELYTRPSTLARHQNGPLVREREAFLRHLAENDRQTRNNLLIAASYLLIVAERLHLEERRQTMIGLTEIEEHANAWSFRKTERFKKGKRSDRARQRFTGFAVRWLAFMGRFDKPGRETTPFDGWIAAYGDYLLLERGLARGTVQANCSHVRRFLSRLTDAPANVASVSIEQVERALVDLLEDAKWRRSTVQSHVGALRGFFRYGQRAGWTPAGMADAIGTPRIYQHELIPAGPSWETVERLIATTDGDDSQDIRDRAILLLFAIYGLRAGEVADLTLDSICWSSATLSVRRGKNRNTQTFPLCRTVGDAILRYLRDGRATSSCRALFLQYWRPLPLRSGGLTRIVKRRLQAAGISLARPGAHALRHSCATRLLQRGLTLKEIGDHLGHRDPESTRVYAKVDLEQLRRVADLDLGGLA